MNYYFFPPVASNFEDMCSFFFTDEDSNGAIDQEEMKKCFHKLEISFSDEEINDLFKACDINEDMGMKFNEFIVLLCLVYLLNNGQNSLKTVSKSHMFLFFFFPFSSLFFSFLFIHLPFKL